MEPEVGLETQPEVEAKPKSAATPKTTVAAGVVPEIRLEQQ